MWVQVRYQGVKMRVLIIILMIVVISIVVSPVALDTVDALQEHKSKIERGI